MCAQGLLVDEEIKTPERDSISVLEYKREMRKKEVAALETKADEGIKAANDRADIAIGEANKRADDAIAEA